MLTLRPKEVATGAVSIASNEHEHKSLPPEGETITNTINISGIGFFLGPRIGGSTRN